VEQRVPLEHQDPLDLLGLQEVQALLVLVEVPDHQARLDKRELQVLLDRAVVLDNLVHQDLAVLAGKAELLVHQDPRVVLDNQVQQDLQDLQDLLVKAEQLVLLEVQDLLDKTGHQVALDLLDKQVQQVLPELLEHHQVQQHMLLKQVIL
jgi:hypothetical protein